MWNRLCDEASQRIRARWSGDPCAVVILGTGLGSLTNAMEVEFSAAYGELPGFVSSTSVGHDGRFLAGRLAGKTVLALAGRAHRYEGRSLDEITHPLRVCQRLGCPVMIVSNAAGGLHRGMRTGDLLAIEDHVDLMARRPDSTPASPDRAGAGRGGFGEACYDGDLRARALLAARRHGIRMSEGTYVGVLGPNYETRAEYRMLKRWGDAVGMSTVDEVVTAISLKMRVLGVSVITNVAVDAGTEVVDGGQVASAAGWAEASLRQIVTDVVRSL